MARRRNSASRNWRIRPDATARHPRANRHRRPCRRGRDDDRSHEPRQGTRISRRADEAELDDIYETERRLLYVACTRAREHLLLTGVAPTSEYLADFTSDPG